MKPSTIMFGVKQARKCVGGGARGVARRLKWLCVTNKIRYYLKGKKQHVFMIG
jgi:hypothetical protein